MTKIATATGILLLVSEGKLSLEEQLPDILSEIRNYPDTLRAIELKDEVVMLSADDKMELAQEMVLGKEYYERKEVIRTNLNASLQTLDKLMNTTRQNTTAELNQELTIVRVVIIFMTLVILGYISGIIGHLSRNGSASFGDWVFWLYVLDLAMVATDYVLSFYYHSRRKKEAASRKD